MNAKILYVEDNDDNIYMLKRRLERKGFEVLIARTGKDGVSMARAEQPDLVLMDVSMPIVDGLQATAQIRDYETDSRRPRVPIIAERVSNKKVKRRQRHGRFRITINPNLSKLCVSFITSGTYRPTVEGWVM